MIRKTITIACLAASGGMVLGQVYTPPKNEQNTRQQPQDTVTSQPKQQSGPGVFGQEIPLLDPSAETITVGGVTIPLGDNRLLKARFEKYLSQPPELSEDAESYRA